MAVIQMETAPLANYNGRWLIYPVNRLTGLNNGSLELCFYISFMLANQFVRKHPWRNNS